MSRGKTVRAMMGPILDWSFPRQSAKRKTGSQCGSVCLSEAPDYFSFNRNCHQEIRDNFSLSITVTFGGPPVELLREASGLPLDHLSHSPIGLSSVPEQLNYSSDCCSARS